MATQQTAKVLVTNRLKNLGLFIASSWQADSTTMMRNDTLTITDERICDARIRSEKSSVFSVSSMNTKYSAIVTGPTTRPTRKSAITIPVTRKVKGVRKHFRGSLKTANSTTPLVATMKRERNMRMYLATFSSASIVSQFISEKFPVLFDMFKAGMLECFANPPSLWKQYKKIVSWSATILFSSTSDNDV